MYILRCFINGTLPHNDSNDQITKEKCPNYATNVGDIVYPDILFVRVLSEILYVDGRTIMKWILQKENKMLWTLFIWLEENQILCCCVNGNEHRGFIKGGTFSDSEFSTTSPQIHWLTIRDVCYLHTN